MPSLIEGKEKGPSKSSALPNEGSSLADQQRLDSLSPRQLATFNLLVRGCNVKDIAHSLHITQRTVYEQRARMFQKLAVTSDRELFVFAARSGYFDHKDPTSSSADLS